MKTLPAIVIVIVAAGGYFLFHAHAQPEFQKKTDAALTAIAQAVQSKDTKKIHDSLQHFLSDTAHIKLEVDVSPIPGTQTKPEQTIQELDKAAFIDFVDTLLYSMDSYSYEPQLTDFRPGLGGATASITFTSSSWAEGMAYEAGMGLHMRFNADTSCHGDAAFDGTDATLATADCKIKLSMTPK